MILYTMDIIGWRKNHTQLSLPKGLELLVNDYSGFFNHSVALTELDTPRWTSNGKIGLGAYNFNGSTKNNHW